MGARTRNTYTGSLRAFVRWAVADGRMAADPLGTLTRGDEAGDRRRKRRALTEAELAALLRVAELRPLAEYGRTSIKRSENPDGKPGPLSLEPLTLVDIGAAADRAAMKLAKKPVFVAKLRRLGHERSLIYRTLVLTGLRRGELAEVTWGDLSLDGPQAWLTVRATVAKNRKADALPIRADLAAALRAWRTESGDVAANSRVFRVPVELVKILDRDLVAAGIARRVKGKNGRWRIDKRDADGRTVDVHALRHTTATYLAKAGVAPRTAQTIMRHSDIRLTLGTYTDPKLLDTAAALDALPSMKPTPQGERVRATGTDDATAAGVPAD
jgi:integrase